MADPKFVRLADHLSRGMRADINSGFSIAGLDVVPMPDKEDDPAAYAYVKREISAGRLESASQAEYDEVHPDVYAALGVEVKREMTVQAAPQESQIQREAAKATRAIRANRAAQGDEDGYDADQERREALLEAQRAADDEDAPRARKASRKAAKASRSTPEQPSGADTDDNTDLVTTDEDDDK